MTTKQTDSPPWSQAEGGARLRRHDPADVILATQPSLVSVCIQHEARLGPSEADPVEAQQRAHPAGTEIVMEVDDVQG